MKLRIFRARKDSAKTAIQNRRREFIEIGTTLRIENGPALKVATATKGLLNDAHTARHYFVGAKDALGEEIKNGKPMTFLDYRGPWVWYIYEWNEEAGRWLQAGIEGTKDAAIKTAKRLRKK